MTDPTDPIADPADPAVPASDPAPEIAADASPEERLAAFGRWLARERELRGLSRAQVTRATKLAPGVVEALESGEEPRMPPRAYVVGYLRSYAAAVGLAADDAVLRYEEAIAGAGEPTKRSGVAALPPRAWLGVAAALATAAVIAAALLR